MTLPGFHDYTAGDTLTAAQMDGLHRQSVMYFATAAARNTALSGVLEEGLVAYTADTDTLWYYTGSAWAGWASTWVNFTPSWTNLTVGSATNVGRWCYVPGGFHMRVGITLAADSSVTGSVSMTLPNSFQARNDSVANFGVAMFYDSSATTYYHDSIGSVLPNATTMVPRYQGVAISNGTPITWATGDEIVVDMHVAL